MAFQVSGDTVIDQNQSITSPKITLERTSASESILSGLLNGDSKLEIKADGEITSSNNIVANAFISPNNGNITRFLIQNETGDVIILDKDGNATFDGSVESKNNFFVKAQADDQTCFRVTDLSGGTIRTNLRGDGGAEFASTVKIGNPSNPEIELTGSGNATFAGFVKSTNGSGTSFLGASSTAGLELTNSGGSTSAKILYDGSAEFAGGLFNLAANGGLTMGSPGTDNGVVLSMIAGTLPAPSAYTLFQGLQSDGTTQAFAFKVDGSATFAGSLDVAGLTVNGAPVSGDVDLSGYDTSAEVDQKIANLVGTASSTLDTLGEIADALSDNQSVATSITVQLGLKANTSSLANVATSGSYNDLTNKPSIPTHTSSLTNNSGFITNTNSTFPSSYYEFGNGTGSVSNDGSWNARLNLAGSSHARLDVKSVSDGIITSIFSHTGNGAGRIGTSSNHPLKFMTGGNNRATLSTSGTFTVDGPIVSAGTSSDKGARLGNIQVGYGAYYNTIQTDDLSTILYLQHSSAGGVNFNYNDQGSVTVGSAQHTVWHAGNDGSGSGLDADKLDGQEGSYYLNYNNLTNKPTITADGGNAATLDGIDSSQFLRSDTGNTISTSADQKLILSGSNAPYIRFQSGTTDKAYLQYDTPSSAIYLWNQEHNTGLRLGSLPQFYDGSGYRTIWNSGNDGSGSGLDADLLDGLDSNSFVKQNESATLDVLGFNGVGGDSGNGNHSYAIYQAGGAWSNPFPDLVISYHTGIRIGAHTVYGGTRFYDDSPDNGANELFSIGNGDAHVRATNNIYTKGKLVSTNGVSSSAPSNPNTGDFWTDTSSDPPLLKSWNGSSWIEVGSAGGSGASFPVISTVSLSEDNTSGARFTSKNFTGTATMTTEGDPVSQKSMKGLLQGNFIKNIRFEPMSIQSQTSSGNWQMNQGSGISNSSQNNISYFPIRSLDAPAGPGTFFLSTSGSMLHLYFSQDPGLSFAQNGSIASLAGNTEVGNMASRNGIFWANAARQHMATGDSVVWDHSGSMFQNSGSYDNTPVVACDGEVIYKVGGSSKANSYGARVYVLYSDYNMSPITGSGVDGSSMNNSAQWIQVDTYSSTLNDWERNPNVVYDEPSDRLLVFSWDSNTSTLRTAVCTINRNNFSNSRLSVESRHTQTLSVTQSSGVAISHSGDAGATGAFLVTMTQGGVMFWNSSTKQWDYKFSVGSINNFVYGDETGIYYNNRSVSGDFEIYHSTNKGISGTRLGNVSNKPSSNNDHTHTRFGGFSQANGRQIIGWHTPSSSYQGAINYRDFTSNAFQVSHSNIGDYLSFDNYTPIRKASDPYNKEFWGYIIVNHNNYSGTYYVVGYTNSTNWQVGDVIESMLDSTTENTTKYLVLNSVGEVSGIVSEDPGFVQQGPGYTHQIKFPSTINSRTPDDLIASGVSLRMEIQATNSSASDTYLSNAVTPT